MINLKRTILSLLIPVSFGISYGQVSKDFPKEVNLVKMTDPGVAVVGTDDALYGIDRDGKELWKNEKLKKVEKERVEILSGSELIFVSDKGMLSRNRVINVLNGVEYANTGVKYENIFGARVVHGTNQLWVFDGSKSIDVWDINTNKKLYTLETSTPYGISTTKSAALTATFSSMQPITYTGEKSAILHLGLSHLGEYNLQTGKPNWMFDWGPYKLKKPNGDKGDRDSNPSRGYATMKVDEANNTLFFPFREMLIAIDMSSGSPKWDVKANKTGKVRDMYVTDEGVLILTDKGLQLVDKSSGALKWDKPIKVKGAADGLMVNDNGAFFIVSKSSIAEVNIAKRSSKALTEKIKFQGGESFSSLEIIDDVIVLSSDHNVVGVDKKTGKILHAVYYKSPGAGIAAIAANVALQAVAASANMHNANVASNSGRSTYVRHTPAMIGIERSGSKSNGNMAYISTKFKDADAKGFGIARVDKATGKTLDKVVIGERDPIYDVDESYGFIFFKSGKTSISVKDIN